jgi:hypothetical protein
MPTEALSRIADYRLGIVASVDGVRHESTPGLLSGPAGLVFVVERAEVLSRAAAIHRGNPPPGLLAPGHSPVLRRRAGRARLVLGVWPSRLREHAQITAAAIQAVAVAMIHFAPVAVLQTHQLAVKFNGLLPATATAANAHAPLGITSNKAPGPLPCKLSVSSVDDGVRPDRSVERPERDTRGQTVVADLEGRGVSPGIAPALMRTVVDREGLGRLAGEGLSARRARQDGAGADSAHLGAESPRPRPIIPNQEVGATTLTDAGDGTLRLHRDLPLTRNRGACPGLFAAGAGLLLSADNDGGAPRTSAPLPSRYSRFLSHDQNRPYGLHCRYWGRQTTVISRQRCHFTTPDQIGRAA